MLGPQNLGSSPFFFSRQTGGDTVDGSEIPNNHLGWLKPYKQWDNRIIIILGGAGFCPSTVVRQNMILA